MRFDQLADLEKSFQTKNASRLSPLIYTSGAEELKVSFFESPNTFHFKEPSDKKRIILHFTAGPLSSDIPQLTPAEDKPNHFVSVPFVVARDGTIYQLFSSKYWAYNLGMKSSDGNVDHIFERESIAIEISNYGVLFPDGDHLKTIYHTPAQPDLYCNLKQEEAFTHLDQPFRKNEYYATFTASQLQSTIKLIRWITEKYTIKREFLEVADRYTCKPSSQKFEGITSHVNYRKDGKWDIGPAFDWDGLIAGVQAPSSAMRSVRKNKKIITEENALKGKTRGARYGKDKEAEWVEYNPMVWERK